VVAERARVSAALRDAGYDLPPSQANFVWLPLAGRTLDFVARAADNRLVVRPYGEDGVRVTVASPAENDAFLEFAAAWIGDR
jgi:histidinol-phosphate aminotransferase